MVTISIMTTSTTRMLPSSVLIGRQHKESREIRRWKISAAVNTAFLLQRDDVMLMIRSEED